MSFIGDVFGVVKRNLIGITIISFIISGCAYALKYLNDLNLMDLSYVPIVIILALPFYVNMLINRKHPVSLRFLLNLLIAPLFILLFFIVYFGIYSSVSDGSFEYELTTAGGVIEVLLTCVFATYTSIVILKFNTNYCVKGFGFFKSFKDILFINVYTFIKLTILFLVLLSISSGLSSVIGTKNDFSLFASNFIEVFNLCVFVAGSSLVNIQSIKNRSGKI